MAGSGTYRLAVGPVSPGSTGAEVNVTSPNVGLPPACCTTTRSPRMGLEAEAVEVRTLDGAKKHWSALEP